MFAVGFGADSVVFGVIGKRVAAHLRGVGEEDAGDDCRNIRDKRR